MDFATSERTYILLCQTLSKHEIIYRNTSINLREFFATQWYTCIKNMENWKHTYISVILLHNLVKWNYFIFWEHASFQFLRSACISFFHQRINKVRQHKWVQRKPTKVLSGNWRFSKFTLSTSTATNEVAAVYIFNIVAAETSDSTQLALAETPAAVGYVTSLAPRKRKFRLNFHGAVAVWRCLFAASCSELCRPCRRRYFQRLGSQRKWKGSRRLSPKFNSAPAATIIAAASEANVPPARTSWIWKEAACDRFRA